MEIVQANCPNVMAKTIGNREEWLKDKSERENAKEGDLKGYDCRKCKNKGYIVKVIDGEQIQQRCTCLNVRKSLKRIEESGLKPLLDRGTFENYIATEDWQKHALSLSQNYVEYGENKWLFFGGQSGSGKTMLCTAVSGELLKRGNALKYMMWRDESTKIKAIVNDASQYTRMVDDLKSVDILYIDDFLKTQQGQMPTSADINLAYEILNYRDVHNLRTIISTERMIGDIIALDEALGGRIDDRTKGYQMNIAKDRNKNYRLRR